MNDMKRIVAFINKEDLKRLKSKLALLELSFSEWLRKTIKDFIKNH
jgi:hypothetical protein